MEQPRKVVDTGGNWHNSKVNTKVTEFSLSLRCNPTVRCLSSKQFQQMTVRQEVLID